MDGLPAAVPADAGVRPGRAGSPSREAAAGKGAAPAVTAHPRALQIELAPPPSLVARSLWLAAGGTFRVDSDAGNGTTLVAELPCAS